MIGLLNQSQQCVLDQIAKYDVDDGGGSFSQARLDALLNSIRAIDIEAGAILAGRMNDELFELAGSEGAWIEKVMNGELPDGLPIQYNIASPTAEQLFAAVNSRPFEGNILKEYYDRLPATIMEPVQRTLAQGFVEGRTTPQIIRDLRGTRAAKYTDGILQQPRRSIEKLVRTAVNHTATTAREEVYKNNEDLISAVRWVSTLDMRTSEICMGLDGQVFEPGVGPRPPAHWNCRSSTTPVVKSWKELGFNIDELPPGTRASMDGQVPATETYQTWLAGQSAAVQDEALGPERAALFRDGMTVDRFTADGRTLTLDELEAIAADPVEPSTLDELAFDLFSSSEEDSTRLWGNLLDHNSKVTRSHREIDGYVPRSSVAALNAYVGVDYLNINTLSRGGEVYPNKPEVIAATQKKLEALAELMTPIKSDFTLYRGIDVKYLQDKDLQQSIRSLEPGNTFISSGLTSTSRSPYTSLGFADKEGVIFQINAKKGARAIITNPGEGEIIFPSKVQFKVKSVDKIKDPDREGSFLTLIVVDLINSSTKSFDLDLEEKASKKPASSASERFSDNFIGKIKKAA